LLLWSIERDGSLKFENEKLVFEIAECVLHIQWLKLCFRLTPFYSDDASQTLVVLHMSESDGTLLAPAFPVFFFVLIGLVDRAGNKAGPLQHQSQELLLIGCFQKLPKRS
jgi:hypothetical protein